MDHGQTARDTQAINSKNESRLHQARRTIGFLPNQIADDTGKAYWLGLMDGARDQDMNLLSFPAWCLNDPRGFLAQANILYDLVSPENCDCIATRATSIGTYVSADEIIAFHAHYRPLPLVCVGGVLEGYASQLINGYAAMCAAIEHLIKIHGKRRLAFIRGPENHAAAQERHRAFVDTLRTNNLDCDAQLISPPLHFDRTAGPAAMHTLLDERKLRPGIDFDAIAAASDVMLLGALRVLQERGIKIPDQVAAVGYNNSVEARSFTPPLSSVDVPFSEIGRQAPEILMDLILGKPVPQKTVTPQLRVRQSCGCADPAITRAASLDAPRANHATLDSVLASRREPVLAAMALAMSDNSKTVPSSWTEQLWDSWADELRGSHAGTFLSSLNHILAQAAEAGGDLAVWHSAISEMRKLTAASLGSDELLHAESLWHQARVTISLAADRIQAHRAFQAAQHGQTMREIEMALLTTFDIAGLMSVLAKNLPRLGIPSCFVALYEDPQPYKYPQPAPEWSRLILACTEKGCVDLEAGGRRFRSRELVPRDLWPQGRQYSFVVEPLFFQDHQLGFVLLEVGPREPDIYDTLRAEISSALKGALLLQEQHQAEQALVHERDALKALVLQIQQSATSVTAASTAILASSTQMATVTEQQASAVNEITATVQEIKSSAAQVALHAQGVAEGASQAAQVSQKGIEAVNAAITGMDEIQHKVEVIAENMQSLSQQTQQIGDIVDTVTDIAGQSNILALNAAIEAAHAGEVGERFRVVADEVKTLAGQSRTAAKQIRGILGDIEKATNLAVAATAQGTRGVDAGSALVARTAQTINELANAADQSARAAQQIVASVQQQTLGLDQIAIGMIDINDAARQSAVQAQQSRKAAEDLNDLAERLKLVVSQFQV